MPLPSESLERLKTVLADRYAIERELARGGMSTVYLANDLRHHRKVAVKLLRPELTTMVGPDRFAREIAIAAQLNHPHILALYDSGEANGGLFYVMPYVAGESLRQKLDREKQLSVEDAIGIVRQAASALDYAHARQLVHRDIKPENILLHEGEAMVADFGIALAPVATASERLTTLGLVIGTPHYMSPEQAAGEPNLDARSDIYSLACVLYELLAGDPPFAAPSIQAVIARRFTEPPPSVRRLRPAIPREVDDAIRKAMAREPSERFASCGAFVQALSSPTQAPARTPSVAVLPFRNLSADRDNEYFADGITEDVIAQLSKIRSVKVISRSSVMRFKDRDQDFRAIGAALDVATVLDGSVRRSGDRVRIVAQLIDAESDQHVWGETYDRLLTDIFAIQSDVAVQITTALEAELSPAERKRIRQAPTANVNAYQSYLQGRFCYARYTEESLRKGAEYFRAAAVADPRFALAYVGIAQCFAEIAVGQGGRSMTPDEAYTQATNAATQALALNADLGEAHSVLALLKMAHDYDWTGSEAEFKRALELSPGSADIYDYYGWLCGSLERYEEGLVLVRRAYELDPLTHRSDVASMLLRAGRYEEALAAAQRAAEFEPNYSRVRSTLGWAHLKLGSVDAGLSNLEHAVKMDPENTLFQAQLGQAYAMYGKPDEARAVIQRLETWTRERYVSPYHLAYVYTGLGDFDRAIDMLERSYRERAGAIYGVKGSFLFTPLHAHPRFIALLRKMNLA